MELPAHEVSLRLTHNEHKSYYLTVKQAIADDDHGYTNDCWVSETEKLHAVETNECWTLQWYPFTPVGFNILSASTLDALLTAACSTSETASFPAENETLQRSVTEWEAACNENAGAWEFERDRASAAEAEIATLRQERNAAFKAYESEKSASAHYRDLAAQKAQEKVAEFHRAEAAKAEVARLRETLRHTESVSRALLVHINPFQINEGFAQQFWAAEKQLDNARAALGGSNAG